MTGRFERLPLWLMGCGNMGGAMLRQWIAAGVPADRVTVIDPGRPSLPDGVHLVADARQATGTPATVVLAVKPQQLSAAVEALRDPLAGTSSLIVSILAGVEEQVLRHAFPDAVVVRAMPNLPVGIGKGVVALHAGAAAAEERSAVAALMRPLGLVEWIDGEGTFDAVTALSGCGPGFVYRFIDAIAAAGAALGLPADQAQRLAVATVEGAGSLAAHAGETAAVLADRVASPGGSTREGLNVLDADDALVRLMTATLAASARRNAEMAAAARA